LINEQLIGMV